MAKKPVKRPTDPWQLAKLIGDIATGQVKDKPVKQPKNKGKAKPKPSR